MPKQATQPGANAEEYEPTDEEKKAVADAQNKTVTARTTELDEVAARQRANRDKELDEAGHEVVDTSGEPGEEKEEEKAEPRPEPIIEKVEEFDTLIVDGVEQQVERDKIYDAGKRSLQKESAADKRLAEAGEKLRLANELMAKANSTTQKDVDVSPSASPVDVKKVAQAMVDGGIEEVEEALTEVMTASSSSTLSPQDIANQVNDTIAINQAMELFKKEPKDGGYGDLFANERLNQMVLDEEEKLAIADRDAGTRRSPLERFKQAAGSVRTFRDELAGTTKAAPNAEGFDELQKKKSQAENTAEATGGRSAKANGAQDDKPMTAAEKRRISLEAMSKARGQDLE